MSKIAYSLQPFQLDRKNRILLVDCGGFGAQWVPPIIVRTPHSSMTMGSRVCVKQPTMLSMYFFKGRLAQSVLIFLSAVALLATEVHFLVSAVPHGTFGDHWANGVPSSPPPLQYLSQRILLKSVEENALSGEIEGSAADVAGHKRDVFTKYPDNVDETLGLDSSFNPASLTPTSGAQGPHEFGESIQVEKLQPQLRAQQHEDGSDAESGDWEWAAEDEWTAEEQQKKEQQQQEQHDQDDKGNDNDDQKLNAGGGVVPQWHLEKPAAEDDLSVLTNAGPSGAGRRTSDRVVGQGSEQQWTQQRQNRNGQQLEHDMNGWFGRPSQQPQQQPLPPQQQMLPPNRNPYGRGGEGGRPNPGPPINGQGSSRGPSGGPFGVPSGGPFGGPPGGPFSGPSGGPFGAPTGGPFGSPSGVAFGGPPSAANGVPPFGQRDGPANGPVGGSSFGHRGGPPAVLSGAQALGQREGPGGGLHGGPPGGSSREPFGVQSGGLPGGVPGGSHAGQPGGPGGPPLGFSRVPTGASSVGMSGGLPGDALRGSAVGPSGGDPTGFPGGIPGDGSGGPMHGGPQVGFPDSIPGGERMGPPRGPRGAPSAGAPAGHLGVGNAQNGVEGWYDEEDEAIHGQREGEGDAFDRPPQQLPPQLPQQQQQQQMQQLQPQQLPLPPLLQQPQQGLPVPQQQLQQAAHQMQQTANHLQLQAHQLKQQLQRPLQQQPPPPDVQPQQRQQLEQEEEQLEAQEGQQQDQDDEGTTKRRRRHFLNAALAAAQAAANTFFEVAGDPENKSPEGEG